MPVTTVTPSPVVLRDAVMQFGNNDHTAACSKIQLSPSSTVKTFRGLTPTANFTGVTSAVWTVDLDFAQSFGANDLLGYLYANEGTSVSFVITPDKGKGASWTGTVILTPAAIGGSGDDFATTSVSLPIQGKPVYTPGT